ncbi:MAG: hypothetical protein JSV09_07840 [Thermoplasmata archaeon]|nr:MAG: hypothetical protein JSV09_07840 [Thermoplasmata archaeon]
MPKADAKPHQDWPRRGDADVVPEGGTAVLLPVEPKSPGAYTIKRSDYPKGVVIVDPAFTTTPPDKTMTWTLKECKGTQETLGPGWSDGIIILFK